MHGLSSLEVYRSTFPRNSHLLTWLLSLSLSLGADRIIFCIRAEAGPMLHTQEGLHFTQPAPLWPRRHSQSRWSVSGIGCPPFCKLLKVFFERPAGAASACSAILLHRWKCLALRARTWVSSFPSCLLLCRLSGWGKKKKRESRSEMCGFLFCKDGHLECGSAVLQSWRQHPEEIWGLFLQKWSFYSICHTKLKEGVLLNFSDRYKVSVLGVHTKHAGF